MHVLLSRVPDGHWSPMLHSIAGLARSERQLRIEQAGNGFMVRSFSAELLVLWASAGQDVTALLPSVRFAKFGRSMLATHAPALGDFLVLDPKHQ